MNNYKEREILEETNILNQLDLFLSQIDADHEVAEKPIKIDIDGVNTDFIDKNEVTIAHNKKEDNHEGKTYNCEKCDYRAKN